MENAALLENRFAIALTEKGFDTLELTQEDLNLTALKANSDSRIAERLARFPICPQKALHQTLLDTLSSGCYRYGPKSYHESACALNETKIARAQGRNMPIFLTFSFFPAKAPNPLKTFGTSCAGVDMGECASLLRLYEIAAILSHSYEPGVRWLIGMDGVKYHEVFGIPKYEAVEYGKNIIKLAEFLGIANYFEFVEETDLYPINFEEKKEGKIAEIRRAYGNCNQTTALIGKLQKSTAFSLNFRGYAIDMLADVFSNIGTVGEIAELRDHICDKALEAAMTYQGIYRTIYDLGIYEEDSRFAEAVKCTVHPKDGQVGVYPVSENVRIFPHHGQGHFKSGQRTGFVKDMRISFAADLLRSNKTRLRGVTLNPSKYPFAVPNHPFLIESE